MNQRHVGAGKTERNRMKTTTFTVQLQVTHNMPSDEKSKLLAWVSSCLNCNTNNARVLVTPVDTTEPLCAADDPAYKAQIQGLKEMTAAINAGAALEPNPSNGSAQQRLEELKALGFDSVSDYQEHQRVMQASRELGAKQAAGMTAAVNFATGEWSHLFGVGSKETRCRIVIDLEQSKLIAAQEWTGLKFEDVRGERLNDLAESVISANNAHEDPCDFGLELTSVLPEWAARREVTFRVHGYTGTEKRVAQENPHFNRDDVTAVARLRSSLLAAEKDQATKA